jgi:hypothetical protein
MTSTAGGILTFGDALLRTGDLDPVYTAIHRAGLDARTKGRLALSYWCFYHLGLAARLAEQKSDRKFWELFEAAVINKDNPDGSKPYPRGAERRHFRGDNAMKAYTHLRGRYRTPEAAIAGMLGGWPGEGYHLPFGAVSKAVQSHVGFGPWIAFKIADMNERVLGNPVDFSDCHLGLYRDPRQGAAVALLEWSPQNQAREYESRFGLNAKPWEYNVTDGELKDTVTHYVKVFRKHKAPPTGDRRVNVQEVETIFCKYKSHLGGHYRIGKDTDEVGHGLIGWGDLAEQLNQGLNDTRDRVLSWRKKNGT